MSEVHWVMRFGELTLKSRVVRGKFQNQLKRNLHHLADNFGLKIKLRIINHNFHIYSDEDVERVEDLLCHLLGVVAVDRIRVLCAEIDEEKISKIILDSDEKFGIERSFGVRVRRVERNPYHSSQSLARAVGTEMQKLDPSLSVNLTSPDFWVRLIMEPERVSIVENRIQGPGGLPSGSQGDVLIRIKNEEDMLAGFLLMRRGTRLVPVMDSDDEFVSVLKRYDPFIGERSKAKTTSGSKFVRPAWGYYGMSEDEVKPLIQQPKNAIKTTPLSSLDPLIGWTNSEKNAIISHIYEPSKYSPEIHATEWMDD